MEKRTQQLEKQTSKQGQAVPFPNEWDPGGSVNPRVRLPT